MVFSSIVFIFYFLPVFLFLYFIIPPRFRNGLILAGSIFFYAWGAPQFVFVILVTTIIDFYVVRAMHNASSKPLKKWLLAASLTVNLGLLFYFKYCDFFIQNVNALLSVAGANHIGWTKVIMPIGISFYTFETLTYVVDVYRGVHKPLRNFWDYQLYIILFPKLIAGPIIRFHDFAHQIYDHTNHENTENRLLGLYRFFIGLGKKVLIANVVGAGANSVFGLPPEQLSAYNAWIGALSYTMQIYFDFSGYSDMAIGLGLMMGFRFPENFNNPYTSLSITDFWRRWHISLGAWMRNYLYIPLGGNKVNSKLRLYFNLWIVFLLSGLWHGATWGFVLWGAYHGFFLATERFALGKWLAKWGKFSVVYTFVVVMVGWVFFRLEQVGPALAYLRTMFSLHPGNRVWALDAEFYTTLVIGALFSFFCLAPVGLRIHQKVFYGQYTISRHFAMAFATVAICILAAGRIAVANFNPFIYFRF